MLVIGKQSRQPGLRQSQRLVHALDARRWLYRQVARRDQLAPESHLGAQQRLVDDAAGSRVLILMHVSNLVGRRPECAGVMTGHTLDLPGGKGLARPDGLLTPAVGLTENGGHRSSN